MEELRQYLESKLDPINNKLDKLNEEMQTTKLALTNSEDALAVALASKEMAFENKEKIEDNEKKIKSIENKLKNNDEKNEQLSSTLDANFEHLGKELNQKFELLKEDLISDKNNANVKETPEREKSEYTQRLEKLENVIEEITKEKEQISRRGAELLAQNISIDNPKKSDNNADKVLSWLEICELADISDE